MISIGSSLPEAFPSSESVLLLSKTPANFHNYTSTISYNMVLLHQQPLEDEEEEEEEKQVTEIPQVFHYSTHSNPNPPLIESQPESPSLLSANRDHTSLISVFPPINHEGLYVSSFHNSFPQFDRPLPVQSADSEEPDSPVHIPIHRPVIMTDWFEFLRCKFVFITSAVRSYSLRSSVKGAPVAAAAMLVAVWYWRFRRQRLAIRRESRDQLIRIIREKDEVCF